MQYKKLPVLEFKEKARIAYDKKYGRKEEIEIVSFDNEVGNWLNKEEAEEALNLFNNYKKNKEITDFSDLELLKRLVAFEIEIKRIQVDINAKRQKNVDADKIFTPTYAIGAINKLTEQVIILRKALGLSEEQKTTDPLKALNQLFKKAKIWRQKNRVAFESRCEHCGKMNLLRIRTEHYDSYKHPFYRDKVVCNDRLWELYKEGTITKEDIGKILEVSPFYVEWLEKKIYGIKDDKPSEPSALTESGD